MRVAYILCTAKPRTGSHIAFKNMLKGVMKKGVEPIIVIPDFQELYDDLKPLGVPIFMTKYRFAIYPYLRSFKDLLLFIPRLVGRQLFNGMTVRKLTAYLRDKDIDIIHTNVSVMDIGFRTARKLGVPHIYHIREFAEEIGMHHFPSKKYFMNCLNKPDSYSICITKGIQKFFNEQGKPTSRVIYDGVFPMQQELDLKEKERYFLFVGRVQPVKGLLQLIQAYAMYLEEGNKRFPLEVIGDISDPPYYKIIQDFIKAKGIQDMVLFHGERSDVYSWMQKARAIIISSLSEGLGFCLSEAMFNGCLTIGNNVDGTKEQMDNGLELQGEEISLRYETIKELAALLKHVASQPIESFHPMILRAFDTVNHLYTLEQHSDQVFLFYKDILNNTDNTNGKTGNFTDNI